MPAIDPTFCPCPQSIVVALPLEAVAGKATVQGRPISFAAKDVVKKSTTTPKSYRVSLRNTSKLNMEDLTVDYELHWVRDNGTGRKGEEKQVTKGTALLSQIMAGKETSFTTEAVKILYKEPFGGRT